VASLAYDRRALQDLDRIMDFLMREDASACEEALLLIHGGIGVLQSHPLIGRMVHDELRELVISHGNTGYVALYHFRNASDHVQVRAIRHQRESGFED
jgi:plasmid stabilization system protein ParE